jgi:hypothetical protein
MEGEEVAHEAARLCPAEEVKPITEAAVEHEIPKIVESGKTPAAEGATEGIQERNPLDRRNMTPEQLEVEAARKAAGKMSNLSGKKFEEFLVRQLGGTGEFEVVSQKFSCTRQFDGAYGNVYYEAKAGGFWAELVKSPTALNEFQSKTIQKQKIAAELGKNFEIHTNSPIPEHIKKWLTKRGVIFHEWL